MLAPQPSASEVTRQANTTCASPRIVIYLPKIKAIKIVLFIFLGCYTSQALDSKSVSYYVARKLMLSKSVLELPHLRGPKPQLWP